MKIYHYPDEILKTPCAPVTSFDERLHKILDEMLPAMKDNSGIGLAANQVGYSMRVFIMLDKKGVLWEFINPEIIEKAGGQQINEGCLSAPGVFVQVPRALYVTVKAKNRHGEEFTIVAEGIDAVCIQHEYDHLDGIFYLEKTSRNQRRAALKQLGLK
jgi:peptide deformylase